ncbi:unnamed protein product [Haemonchus placei]|uniref:Uncharacterized protein n=1 Tax=Haemonchus placei TaxID=6290 RepID=A0A0N4W8A2_HAEPC|nr:unnamed protein product [Haemonchus placei]
MPTDTSPKKSDGNDQAGLKASIVKAIFKDLSPPRTRVVGNAVDLLTATGRISSPSKKLGDLSLSEGDLTLTEDFKTPVSLSVSQSQSHFFANDDFESNPVIESTAKAYNNCLIGFECWALKSVREGDDDYDDDGARERSTEAS